MPKPRLSVAIVFVALATGLLLFLFQLTKDLLLGSLPGLQKWQVDLVPVALGAVIAALASALVLRRQSAEHERIVKDLVSRRRTDEPQRSTAKRSPAAAEPAGKEPEALSAERKEAEAALRASEARYRALVEGAPEGICVHRDGVIEFANEGAAALFGFASAAQLVGRHYGTLVAVMDRARLERDRTSRLAGESVPARFEFQGLRNDGTTVWLECRASRIDWQGQPAVVASLVDISDRKQLERGSGAPEPAPAASRAGREAIVAAHETPAAATGADGASPLRPNSLAPLEPAAPVESAARVEPTVGIEPGPAPAVTPAPASLPTPPLASPSPEEVRQKPESPAWTGPEPVDVAALRKSLGEEALSDMIGTFLGYCPERLESLREAIQEGDSNRLARTAYSLKGALANFGAERARGLAAELEAKGRGGTLQGAPEVFASLEAELERITATLSAVA
jgi:PAS domain S-box-containing protein